MGNPTRTELRPILETPGFGAMYGPSTFGKAPRWPYALDNDMFAHRDDPKWWDAEGRTRWMKMLDKIPRANPPLFCVLPDVVYDWAGTLDRSAEFRCELASRSLPTALALQDGAERDGWKAANGFDSPVIFVGGSRRWKWKHAHIIREEFWREWMHIGRVNGGRLTAGALRIGADSCDGTGLTRFTDAMLPDVLDGLASVHRPALF